MVLRHEYVLLLAFIQKQKGPSGTQISLDLLLFVIIHKPLKMSVTIKNNKRELLDILLHEVFLMLMLSILDKL
jgi:hypothetical protein